MSKKMFFYTENGKGQNAVQVSVDYSKGGYNFWNGKLEPRGYWLHVAVGEASENGRVFCHAPMDSCNFRIFIEETTRLSSKRLKQLQEKFVTERVAVASFLGRKNRVFEFVKSGDAEVLESFITVE